MPIHNLSNIRRLPRLGKISLGIKAKSEKSNKEYPKEVDYFVCPKPIQEIFGEKPIELRIMFPVENPDVFFQQWYKSYGYNLLKCKGDGINAHTWDEEHGGMKEIKCPCEKLEKNECRRIGILQFLLPDVPGAGVWQITTSSRNSIIDINSSITLIKSICGRIRMIPLILKREEMQIQRVENGQPKKGKHYTLKIDLADVSLRQLQEYAQKSPQETLLPPPDESKDDLFYPEKGYESEKEPEEPSESEETEEEGGFSEDAKLNDMKEELFGLVAKYELIGGNVNDATRKRLNNLNEKGTIKDIQVAIDHFKREKAKLDKK